ncbi:RNA-binding protein Prp24 [Coprinopsis cinerea AmutBmut pab1-1]|nr:RNA-binding protein Prp24 [Coprinopsis cinerea AmutBmut pab1-1]
MDDTQSLEAVSDILNQISEKPLDIGLHLRHIELANKLDDLESQLSAFQMMADFVAVGDEVWLPLIEARETSVDLETEEGVAELLQLFERAESDYLSIPILQKHLKFILDGHARYTGEDAVPKPATLGEVFSTGWSLVHIEQIVAKGISHLSQSRLLFDAQRDWLLEQLETSSPEDRPILQEHLETLLNVRLKQPHSNSDETFQTYSSFTTKYKSPAEYEQLMVAASKVRGASVKAYERRDSLETSLTQSNNSLDSFAQYISFERRARYPDLLSTRGIYERAITEAASRRHKGEQGSEQALRAFWAGYLDAMRIQDVGIDVEQVLYTRALRSAPASGEVWSRYIRFLERAAKSMDTEGLESPADAYSRAISSGAMSDVENIISVTLAYTGWEKRRIEAQDPPDYDDLPNLIAAAESAIDLVLKADKAGDPKFRLEKFLAGVLGDVGLVEDAVKVWKAASKKHKGNYAVWLNYTETLIKHKNFEEARSVFTEVHTKRMDWPEAVWEAWLSFEQLHGSVETIDSCLDKIEKAQAQLNFYRAREMEKAYQNQQQYAAAARASATDPATDAMNVDAQRPSAPEPSAMDVDTPAISSLDSKKRRTDEDEPSGETSKRARFETNPPALKRDRENTTVFVADLPEQVTEDELKSLFKDCGSIREVKITKLPNAVVALVEFFERDSVPAALTKDKKRLQGQEISVHLAWKSTLYVTNFPESADDAYIRNLFGTASRLARLGDIHTDFSTRIVWDAL